MLIASFSVLIIISVIIFYLIIGKYYVTNQYELKEIENNKTTHIRGNYIDITYDNERIRINKKSDNNWYLYKFKTDENIELHYNKPFKLGNKKFIIIKEEKRGGFFALIPIVIVIVTILSLLQQSNAIIKNNESNNIQSQYDIEEEKIPAESDRNQTESNIEDSDYLIDNKDEENITTSDIKKDIHTIVLENDSLFQYNISIDWDSYQNEENMRRSLENNLSEIGISVSKYQETIDWEKVKADGIDFAIIQVGSRGTETGAIYKDTFFNVNMDGAMINDIKAGVCIYSQAITQDEVDEEIELILNSINNYILDYPIGFSLERNEQCRTISLSDEEYIDIIKYYCIRISQEGYTPMIMGNEEWFLEFPEDTFNGYLKLVYSPNTAPSHIDNCIIWQYRQNTKGIVNGINNKLVLSINLSAYISENKIPN